MPTVTKNLIIINVLLFLAQFVAQSYGINLSDYLGLHFFLADNFNPAQLFTYMFMHGDSPTSSLICLRYGCSDGSRTSMGPETFFILLYPLRRGRRLTSGRSTIHTIRDRTVAIYQCKHRYGYHPYE